MALPLSPPLGAVWGVSAQWLLAPRQVRSASKVPRLPEVLAQRRYGILTTSASTTFVGTRLQGTQTPEKLPPSASGGGGVGGFSIL